MRKQYHSKRVGDDVLIWDVDRLVGLADALPVTRVALASIRDLDQVRWFDDESERPTCRAVLEHMRLVVESDPTFPILLGDDGRVMDGMHRVIKVALEGRAYISARRFAVDPEPDFVNVDVRSLPY